MIPNCRIAALAGLSVLLLAGCQSAAQKANCPAANVLANASSLTAFKANMEGNPAAEAYTVQMIGLQSSCSFDKDEGTTDTDLELTFRATRAVGGDGGHYTAPYFVTTLIDGATVVKKDMKAIVFDFAAGQTTVTFNESVPDVLIKMDNGKRPYQYGLLAGFQLTREQLDYNKRMGRFAQ
jgi:hypothetical protein